ncbi:MAG TPA: hypothetical protein VGM51_01505 [Armatimonadota bacterium]|jgi:hypothetical protein
MPYKCATWESDGFKRGPRHAPTLAGRYLLPGQLQKEEVHASLQSPLRVLLATYLGLKGPSTTPELAQALGCSLDRIGTKLRGMRHGGVVDCVRLKREAGYIGSTPRAWWITETGRWALWRQAWMTRSAFCPGYMDWDPGTVMPDDPVEAVRLHVREEFLRPGSYRGIAYMMRWGLVTMRETAIALGIAPAIMYKRMHWWERNGWVEQTKWPHYGLPGQEVWCWLLTYAGNDAALYHASALRMAAIACGWTPTPGGVRYGPGYSRYEWEQEFLDMGWKM